MHTDGKYTAEDTPTFTRTFCFRTFDRLGWNCIDMQYWVFVSNSTANAILSWALSTFSMLSCLCSRNAGV